MGKEAVLSSSESTKNSLEAIRCGRAGLSLHRKQLLSRVLNSGEWITLNKNIDRTGKKHNNIIYYRNRKRIYRQRI
jgi:hypothetical protein